MRSLLTALLMLGSTCAIAADNLVLVTIDGVRWQEVYRGLDNSLITEENTQNRSQLLADFDAPSAEQKRQKLMPFIWGTLAKRGTLLGNRDLGSHMQVANPWYFSYPGYNEIITGQVDEGINSNNKIANPHISFIEWLNNQDKSKGSNAAFASWDVFPYIFNEPRSKLHVNAGFMPEKTRDSDTQLLNTLQEQIPSPWESVRLDAFTYHFAKNYIQSQQPNVLFLGLGEPDDFAHNGNYEQYIRGIHRSDKLIADLWNTLQAMPQYRDNTVMLITTDHGRGSHLADWQHHSSKRAIEKKYPAMLEQFPKGIEGSEHTWFAAIGPNIAANGEYKASDNTNAQIAATALMLLGKEPSQYSDKVAPAINEVLK
ncbi:alkaline phosphatase family protein [Pseudoalteromonas pernae]|uniref:alkaline phosphatase family protein n=1 Tax=Pseudoalteromonas pernae TaxID=3118054 RepID=UPI00324215A6